MACNIIGRLVKKDPRHQLGTDRTLEKIEEVTKIDKTVGGSSNNLNGNMFTSTRSYRESSATDQKIIVEANEGISVGIYDEKGSIKWGFVGALTESGGCQGFGFEPKDLTNG
jgi:phosphosulfolactate synthase